MASEIETINLALSFLGETSITSMIEDSVNANAVRIALPITRESLLTVHTWDFSLRRLKLEVSDHNAPAWGYQYSYPLPADCLRLIQVGLFENDPNISYKVEDRNILTDYTDILILYITRDINLQHASPLFIEAFAAKLAMNISTSLEGSKGMLETMASLYANNLSVAIQADNVESNYLESSSSWVNARWGNNSASILFAK